MRNGHRGVPGHEDRNPKLTCDHCAAEHRAETGEIERTVEYEKRNGDPVFRCECSTCIEDRERIEARATNNHDLAEYSQCQ